MREYGLEIDLVSAENLAEAIVCRCSTKFRKFHGKISTLESLFNKVAGLKTCNFIKKRHQHRCFIGNLRYF